MGIVCFDSMIVVIVVCRGLFWFKVVMLWVWVIGVLFVRWLMLVLVVLLFCFGL